METQKNQGYVNDISLSLSSSKQPSINRVESNAQFSSLNQNAQTIDSCPVRQDNNRRSLRNFMAMTLANSKNSYVNFSCPRSHPEISRIGFPYFMDDETPPPAPKPNRRQVKIVNRVLVPTKQAGSPLEFKYNKVDYEEPPVNEFLCYDLSKEINTGLCDVKVLAQQIRRIRQEKLEEIQDKDRYKPGHKIKIKRRVIPRAVPKLQPADRSPNETRGLR